MEGYLDTEEAKLHGGDYGQENGIPMFLKVLCILTFVGAGIGLLSGIYSLLMNERSLQVLEGMSNNPFGGTVDYTAYIEKMRKWGVLVAILNIVANGLCLGGALMMWKLKKSGFYMYVVGQIVPFIALYGLLGGMMPNMGPMQGIMVVAQVFGFIFPAAFVVMYGLNLKHLK